MYTLTEGHVLQQYLISHDCEVCNTLRLFLYFLINNNTVRYSSCLQYIYYFNTTLTFSPIYQPCIPYSPLPPITPPPLPPSQPPPPPTPFRRPSVICHHHTSQTGALTRTAHPLARLSAVTHAQTCIAFNLWQPSS